MEPERVDLIPEAQAQTAEATKLGVDAGNVLLQYQVLGAFCLFLIALLIGAALVIRHLYRDIKALNAVTVSDRERLITALERNKDSLQGVETALIGVKTTLDTRAQGIVDLSHQFEIIAKDLRHGLNNLSQSVEGIFKWVREGRIGGAP